MKYLSLLLLIGMVGCAKPAPPKPAYRWVRQENMVFGPRDIRHQEFLFYGKDERIFAEIISFWPSDDELIMKYQSQFKGKEYWSIDYFEYDGDISEDCAFIDSATTQQEAEGKVMACFEKRHLEILKACPEGSTCSTRAN